MEQCFGLHVGSQLLATLEDVLHDSNFQRIILMSWRSPTNSGFQSIFAEKLYGKDVLLEISEEWLVPFFTSDLQCPANVLEKMHMADLDDATREDVLSCHADRIVLVAGHGAQRITRVLEFGEELHHGLEVL